MPKLSSVSLPHSPCLSFLKAYEWSLLHIAHVSHRILDTITALTKTNKHAMSRLYKMGAFEILLWKLLAGDIVQNDKAQIAKFLQQSHLHQVGSLPNN